MSLTADQVEAAKLDILVSAAACERQLGTAAALAAAGKPAMAKHARGAAALWSGEAFHTAQLLAAGFRRVPAITEAA